jgi:hypothetical protein
MISSFLMLVVTLALFAVWFRYTCVLILKSKPAKDYSLEVASANELNFVRVQRSLPGVRERSDLDTMLRYLDGDYRLLTYILRHGAQFQIGASPLERRILMLDFEIMRIWYAFAGRVSLAKGRKSLQEMISIIAHLANFMGERAIARAD